MSESFQLICCHWCVRCCCPGLLSEKHQQTKYQSLEKANRTLNKSHHFQPAPFKKAFTFYQPRTEYVVHPQASDINDQSSVISEQPKPGPYGIETGRLSSPVAYDTQSALEFTLYYDIQKNVLTVQLLRAFNIPTRCRSGLSNTCVILYLLPHKLEVFESQIVKKNANPVYHQTFQFSNISGSELLRKQSLVFQIFEYNRLSSRDLVGKVTIDLADADLFGIVTKMEIERVLVPSQDDISGNILLSLTYKPEQCTIDGVILRVANLHHSDLSGTRDPYVKVCLYHNHVRQYQWKTSTKKQALNPVYNEQFAFDIRDMTLDNVALKFMVMDYDRFGRDIVIGTVMIGTNVTEDMSKAHWEEITKTPNHAVSRWHKMVHRLHTTRRTYTL